MNETTVAVVISMITGAFSLFGVPGITSTDIAGFMHVVTGIASLAGIAWTYFSHKKALGRALAGKM